MKELFVFDFDWSLLELDNSDEFIFKELAPDLLTYILQRDNYVWTELLDNLMGMLWERGICKQDIIGAFQKLCVLQDMKDMLEFMRKRHVNMKILSNGNTVFIKAILEASGIDIFKDEDIICNPSYFNEDEKVVINAYHSHDCSMCPVNLCKGKVMKLILEQNYDRVFYLGDGEGDFCPGTLLKKNDVFCVRDAFPLQEKVYSEEGRIKSNIIYWSNGKDLWNKLSNHIYETDMTLDIVLPLDMVEQILRQIDDWNCLLTWRSVSTHLVNIVEEILDTFYINSCVLVDNFPVFRKLNNSRFERFLNDRSIKYLELCEFFSVNTVEYSANDYENAYISIYTYFSKESIDPVGIMLFYTVIFYSILDNLLNIQKKKEIERDEYYRIFQSKLKTTIYLDRFFSKFYELTPCKMIVSKYLESGSAIIAEYIKRICTQLYVFGIYNKDELRAMCYELLRKFKVDFDEAFEKLFEQFDAEPVIKAKNRRDLPYIIDRIRNILDNMQVHTHKST